MRHGFIYSLWIWTTNGTMKRTTTGTSAWKNDLRILDMELIRLISVFWATPRSLHEWSTSCAPWFLQLYFQIITKWLDELRCLAQTSTGEANFGVIFHHDYHVHHVRQKSTHCCAYLETIETGFRTIISVNHHILWRYTQKKCVMTMNPVPIASRTKKSKQNHKDAILPGYPQELYAIRFATRYAGFVSLKIQSASRRQNTDHEVRAAKMTNWWISGSLCERNPSADIHLERWRNMVCLGADQFEKNHLESNGVDV